MRHPVLLSVSAAALAAGAVAYDYRHHACGAMRLAPQDIHGVNRAGKGDKLGPRSTTIRIRTFRPPQPSTAPAREIEDFRDLWRDPIPGRGFG